MIGILIFILQVWGTIMDLRRDYDELMSAVISSNKLDDYKIKKVDWFDRILFGASIGLFIFLILMIFGVSLKWSLISALIVAIMFMIAPRHF